MFELVPGKYQLEIFWEHPCSEETTRILTRKLLHVYFRYLDFNIVAFNWTPNTLLAEDLENVAKVLEDYNEDTTFWIGDLNFNETYSHL